MKSVENNILGKSGSFIRNNDRHYSSVLIIWLQSFYEWSENLICSNVDSNAFNKGIHAHTLNVFVCVCVLFFSHLSLQCWPISQFFDWISSHIFVSFECVHQN